MIRAGIFDIEGNASGINIRINEKDPARSGEGMMISREKFAVFLDKLFDEELYGQA